MARWLIVLLALLTSAAAAQPTFSIDFSKPHQTIQGLGVTATGTWIPEVAALYGQESFAKKAHDDLGVSIIRLALPPEIQPTEDLDTAALNLKSFDFSKFNPPANFIQNIHKADPSVKVIFSIWSPPAWMKTNSSTKNGGKLRPDRREHFGKFCAAACLGFEKTHGVPVYALSIQNEPHFVEPYDSCVYTPEELRDTIDAVSKALRIWNVKTVLMGPEDVADDPRWMKFAAAATTFKYPNFSILNVHNEPGGGAAKNWPKFQGLAKKAGLPLWMTETSGEQPTWLGTKDKPGALDLSRKIHDALVFGGCEAWVYWAITDPEPTEFALMSLAEPTPKFYAASQFFRYIRPGAQRLDVSPGHREILISAFHDDRQTTIIVINTAAADREVTLSLANAPAIVEFKPIRSSATLKGETLQSLPVSAGKLTLSLPAQSVTTLVAEQPK